MTPTLRPICIDKDLPAVANISRQNATRYSQETQIDEAELRSDLLRPQLVNVNENVRLAELNGKIIGIAELAVQQRALRVDLDFKFQTLPDSPTNIATNLLEWSLHRARAISTQLQLPVELMTIVGAHRPDCAALCAQYGFRVARHLVEMRRSMDKQIKLTIVPPGYSIRAVDDVGELRDWTDVLNESFAKSWRYSAMTYEQARHFVKHDPSYRQHGNLIAISHDGSKVGLCQVVVRTRENSGKQSFEGRIAWLAVRPAHRTRGLGAALLCSALSWLRDQQIQLVTLGTDDDGDNRALALYRSAGFSIMNEQSCYVITLRPGESRVSGPVNDGVKGASTNS